MNAPEAAGPALDNPFIGVRPYPEGRTLYGREQEAAELADLIISRRIALLYSPSGAGKTSLINTALRKDLVLRGKGRFRASKAIRVGYFPEGIAGNRYVVSALHYLEKTFPDADQLPDAALAGYTLARYLAERWGPLTQAAEPKSRRELLVFDQFEELFTLDPTDVAAKREFLVQVAEALGDRDEDEEAPASRAPLRWALFAMREDFIAELDPYKALLPTALATRFRMNLLSREAAARVILCTAADAGAEFGEDAIERIVADLSRVRSPRGAPGQWMEGLFVEPVQLQVVCRRLWSRHMRDGKRYLRPEDLGSNAEQGDDARALGAVDDALAQFYADCVRDAAEGSTTRERALRDWIESALVSKAKLRCQVMLDPATPLPVPEEALRTLGGTLLRKDTRGGREWIELTHDRLIEPLLWDNNRWRGEHLSLLQLQAHLWNAAGRIDGYLLTGDALEQASAWASTHGHELSDVDREFLGAALKARDDAASRRRGRIFRRLGTVTTVITLLLTGAYWKLVQVNRALDAEKEQAQAQTEIANRQTVLSRISGSLSEADVLRGRDLIGAIRSALVSAGQLGVLERTGTPADVLAAERITVDASLLDSLRQAPPVVTRYAAHGTAVRKALFAPDGRVVSLGQDGALRLWRASDGRTLKEIAGAGRPVFAAVLSASRGVVADGDGAERVRLWRLGAESLDPLAVIDPPPGQRASRITALALLQQDKVLVASTWDRRLLFFDIADPAAPRRFAVVDARMHDAAVQGLAASADGRRLATGSWDGTVGVWRDLPTPQDPDRVPRVERLATDPDADRPSINTVAFSPGGNWLAAGGHDGSVFLWEDGPAMAKSLRRLKGEGGHDGTVFGVAFDAAETVLASVAIDRRVVLWRLADARKWQPGDELPVGEPFPALPERLYGVAFDPAQPRQLALAAGPSVFVVDTGRGVSPLAERLDAPNGVQGTWSRPWRAIAISADGRLVAASVQGHVSFWSAQPDERYRARTADAFKQDGLTRLAMDAAGQVVVTGTRTGEVRVRRIGGATTTELAPPSGQRVIAIALSREGRTAAASIGGELLVWRIAGDGGATLLAREPLGPQRVRALAFDSGGERIAAGAADGSVRVWRVGSAGLQADGASQAVQASEINVIAFAPDDKSLATGAEDSTLAIWSLPGLAPVREYTEHRSGVVSVAFCQQGEQVRMLSSDRDGEVIARLSLEEPRHTRTLMQSFGRPRYLAVTPDCDRAATSGTSALAWNLEPGFVRRQACELGDPGEDPLSACDGVRQVRAR